jgi:uncharacterized membrane protein YcaP (DUF421 family)
MMLRTVIVFFAALLIVRIGHKRFLGRYTPFDIVLGFIIGSTFSRAINGKAPLFESIAASFVLVGLHWILASITYRYKILDVVVKGKVRKLVENGEVLQDAMAESHITEGDLHEALRIQGKVTDVTEAGLAILERNGEISVIPIRKS